MKNIFKIYKRDMKNIFSNKIAIIVVIGLIILPSLYAWFNIKSSWDPYGNTSQISVAIANKDKGSKIKDKNINVGEELVQKLKQNKNIGWKFLSEEEAKKGVKYGKYYACIIIPENFSYKILSITRDKLEKPDLIYYVNEKTNAIAPKITEKGVTGVQDQINKTFVKTVNGIIFKIFNEVGIELDKGKPKLESLKNMVFEVDAKIPKINKDIDEVYKGVITLQEFTKRIDKDMPLIEDTIKLGSDVTGKAQNFLVKFKEGVNNVAPFIKEDLIIARSVSDTVSSLSSEAINFVGVSTSKVREVLVKARDRVNNALDRINNVINFLQSIDNKVNNKVIHNFVNKLERVRDKLNSQLNLINSVIDSIDRGEKPSREILNTIENQSKEITLFLDDLINNYDSTIVPNINKVMDELITISNNTLKLLQDANKELPVVKDLLQKTYIGTEKGIEEIKLVKQKLPAVEKSIHEITKKLRKLDNDEVINEIIKLLKNDAVAESEFIANPVNIKRNRMFPIPNYGSGMAPFFSTLALWVGALILVSILSVEAHELEKGKKLKVYEAYFGRYLTFMTIAIFQALIVTLGDLFILKIYAANKGLFVIYSVFISIIFSMIVYSLVSVFGNVGKALSVILLVLQISASGGTFPIEVTPPFFRFINPFLPFTYAIMGMREAVGGVLWDTLFYSASRLVIYFFLAILMTFLLKKKLSNMNKKFIEKFKNSGLVEE